MITSTVAGLLIFLAATGPGYVYVRIVERRRPYSERTPLRELAEIVVAGSIASLIGVVSALSLVDFKAIELAKAPGRYLLAHPGTARLALFIVLGVSYGIAVLVAILRPGKGARVYPDSAWYGMLERELPENHGIFVTVGVKERGAVSGGLAAFTSEPCPVDERELVIGRTANQPAKVRSPSGVVSDLQEGFVILRGADIEYVAGEYVALPKPAPAGQSSKNGFAARLRRCLKYSGAHRKS